MATKPRKTQKQVYRPAPRIIESSKYQISPVPSPHLSLPSSGPPLSALNGRPKESPRDSRHGTSKRWPWMEIPLLHDMKQLTNQDCCLHSLLHQVWQKLSQFSQQCCGNIACRVGLNFKHAKAMSERCALCLEPPHSFCRC